MINVNELFLANETINAAFDRVMDTLSALDSNGMQALICKLIMADCESPEDATEYALSIFTTMETMESIAEYGFNISMLSFAPSIINASVSADIISIKREPIGKCPICGHSVSVKQSDNGKFYVRCDYCPLTTDPIFRSAERAIEYFNDRRM